MHRFCFIPVVLLLLLPLGRSGSAQEEAFALPSDPAMWVNSAPISLEALKGKSALLWFYEEDCPRCRGKWPEMIGLSKKFEGRPIVFIGVNSGNLRPNVQNYLREVSVPWPTIADPTRQFEKLCGVPEISLQNIYQVRTIGPDGRLQQASFDNLAGAAEAALVGAKWNIDPASIPAPLKPAWTAVEFGDYAAGAALIKKSLNANKLEIKQGAAILQEYVDQQIDQGLAAAQAVTAMGDPWKAYSAYHRLTTQFAGYSLPGEVTSQLKQLAANDDVKKELARQKQLQGAKKSLTSTSRAGRVGAINRLKKLVQEAPESDAGKQAGELLQQLDGASP